MSRELDDPDYDVEVTLANGQLLVGPNAHPAELVRWVASLFLEPERVIPDDCGGTHTGRELVERYLSRPDGDGVGGVSHADMVAALQRFR